MGILNKLFGKKNTKQQDKLPKKELSIEAGDAFVALDNNTGLKIISPLTPQLKDSVEQSRLLLRTGQLYMHYWVDDLACKGADDQTWLNTVVFFWKAEEPFPKKSLPPAFKHFKSRHFLFEGDAANVSTQVGLAAPWFGMPGLGEKFVCKMNGKEVSIPTLNELGTVQYYEQIELTNDTQSDLLNKEECFFLINEGLTYFHNGNFYLRGKPISISLAYEIGGITLIKKKAY